MIYTSVTIDAIGYELAPNVITSAEIEEKLAPFYDAVGFSKGQLVALTGIRERRFWDPGHTLAQGSIAAGRKAIQTTGADPAQIGALVFCGVGRDGFEPATACAVADALSIDPGAQVYDVSNACLGVITGMIQVANAIELGQISAGLVVSCETARQIVEATITEINENADIAFFKKTIATMTGGSGAVAVLLSNGRQDWCKGHEHVLRGGVVRQACRHHQLCRWGFDEPGMPTGAKVTMRTDAHGVLEHGLSLARETFGLFRQELGYPDTKPDKFICHQVGSTHQQMFHATIGISPETDFSTYPFLGNMGTVSLPMTAAIADERGFLQPGDAVGFLGIGSGLNCVMLGVDW